MESVTITFKLAPDLDQQLDRMAQQMDGMSKHKLARQMVIERLKDTESKKIIQGLQEIHERLNETISPAIPVTDMPLDIEAIQELHRHIDQIRKDVALATTVLLLWAGKIEDPAQARQWVKDKLRR